MYTLFIWNSNLFGRLVFYVLNMVTLAQILGLSYGLALDIPGAPSSEFPEPSLPVETWSPRSLLGVGWLNPEIANTGYVIVRVRLGEKRARILEPLGTGPSRALSPVNLRAVGELTRVVATVPHSPSAADVTGAQRHEVTCMENQDPELSPGDFRACPAFPSITEARADLGSRQEPIHSPGSLDPALDWRPGALRTGWPTESLMAKWSLMNNARVLQLREGERMAKSLGCGAVREGLETALWVDVQERDPHIPHPPWVCGGDDTSGGG